MQELRPSRPGVALIVAIVGVAVLTAFAAIVPVEARKLLLFSAAFGLCSGGIVVWTAREFGLAGRWAVCLTVPLIVAGLMLIAIQGHHRLQAEQTEAAKADPEQTMALNILDAAAESDPALATEMAERRRRQNPSFTDYLALRVRPLGEWSQPWPELFWAAELFLATAVGVLLVSRLLRAPRDLVEENL